MTWNLFDASQNEAIPQFIDSSHWQLVSEQPVSTIEEECGGGKPGPGTKGEDGELSDSVVYDLSHLTVTV